MKAGFAASLVGHLTLLAWGLLVLPHAKPLDVSVVEAMPVELVPIAEETSLQKGKKTAEMRDKPSPEKSQKDAPKPTPAPPKPKAAEAKPPPPPPPPPAAEPTPPKPPEPKPPEPAPTPPPPPEPAPEPKPDPAPAVKPEPAPEPAPAPKEADATPPPTPAPKPRVKPTPPKPTEVAEAPKKPVQSEAQQKAAETKDDFDPDRIAALLDRSKPTGATQASQEPESFGASEAVNASVKMSQSELDALRAQVQRCWNIPVGWTDPREVAVTLRFRLNQDGTVNGVPSVVEFPASQYGQVSAESATRAVLQCGPYQLPAEKYDQWSEVQMRFAPQS